MTGVLAGAVLVVCATVYVAGVVWFTLGVLRRPGRPAAVRPTVAVVVAARDEADNVEACLRALGRQTYPRDHYEVVLVDDGSTDGTGPRARAVARALRTSGVRVRILDGAAAYGARGSKKAALSLAIARSRGEVVLTTDADCLIPPTWVQTMAGCFAEGVGAVVGFSQIGAPGVRQGLLAAWEGVDFLQLMSAAAGSCALGHPIAGSGQSLGFRRAAFAGVGGYECVRHRASGDDVLLLQLIRGAGRWRVVFCHDPGSHVIHPPSPGPGSFLRQRARWASNAPCQLRLDPAFFSYLVATFGLAAGLTVAPVLCWSGVVPAVWVLGVWGTKAVAELGLSVAGAWRFQRFDLLRGFPLWALLHPLYTTVMGCLGPLGLFRWKGRACTLGREPRYDRGLPAGGRWPA